MQKDFYNAVQNENLDHATSLYNIILKDNNFATKREELLKDAFGEAIIKNNLNIVKWLYNLEQNSLIIKNISVYFKVACERGYLDMAKWIYEQENKPNLHYNNEEALRLACGCGHLDVVNWLFSLNIL